MGVASEIKKNQDKEAMLKRSLKRIVELYSDKIHFIYELLQNAEDAKASIICFRQFSDRLEVLHNGIPFSQSNLQSICDAALSDKIYDENMIGKFGLGFKSVFTICNTVELYSEPSNYSPQLTMTSFKSFGIRIENYIDPTDIDCKWDHEKLYTTKFIFQYHIWDKFYKSKDDMKKAIANKLLKIGSDALLFLKNINEIRYGIYDIDEKFNGEGIYRLEREQLEKYFFKVTPVGKKNDCSYFVFSKNIDKTERTVDISFSIIEKNTGIEFIKSNIPYISVYFPTEMESGLNFIIQAPFEVTPNRSSLIIESDLNSKLILLLAELLKDAVRIFRDKNLLSLELLSLLPYKNIDGGNLIKQRDKIVRELNISKMIKAENIIPTIDANIYVTAKDAKIARKRDLIEIFKGDLLNKLLNQPNAKWLSGNFTENNQRLREMHSYFHRELNVDLIGSDDLPKLLKLNPAFLKNVDDEWLIGFYNFLSDPKNRIKSLLGKNGDLATIPFIKTDDGNINAPYVSRIKGNIYELEPNIYIKPYNVTYDINGFLFINSHIEENCPELIQALGLEEPNKLDYFIRELKYGKNKEPSDDVNIKQIKKAIQYLRNDSDSNIDIFKEYLWFKVSKTDGTVYFCKLINSNIYRENDFNGLSIKDYFVEINCNICILNEQFYVNNSISHEELRLLLKLGISDSIYFDPYPSHWTDGRADCCNIDNFRKHLDFINIHDVIRYIKNNHITSLAKRKSEIIFQLLLNSEKHLQGIWKYRSTNSEYKEDVSQIVKTLKNNKWLFSENKLVSSNEISRYDLDINIYRNNIGNSSIYEILEFKRTEQDIKSELLKEILNKYTNEQIKIFIEKYIQEYEDEFDPTVNNDDETFPIETIVDLVNLKNSIKHRYLSAKDVSYEIVRRQIRTSRGRDKEHIRYRYHGFCQLCQRKSPYWEVAEIFLFPKKELEQMNLSLCPNCASEYRILRNNSELMDAFEKRMLNINPAQETNIILTGKKCMKFTSTHLAEIQEIIRIEDVKKMIGNRSKLKKLK